MTVGNTAAGAVNAVPGVGAATGLAYSGVDKALDTVTVAGNAAMHPMGNIQVLAGSQQFAHKTDGGMCSEIFSAPGQAPSGWSNGPCASSFSKSYEVTYLFQ